jgi:hypothetical protein
LFSGFLTLIILRFEGQRDLDAVLVLVIAFLAFLAMGVGIYLIAADRLGVAPPNPDTASRNMRSRTIFASGWNAFVVAKNASPASFP